MSTHRPAADMLMVRPRLLLGTAMCAILLLGAAQRAEAQGFTGTGTVVGGSAARLVGLRLSESNDKYVPFGECGSHLSDKDARRVCLVVCTRSEPEGRSWIADPANVRRF